MASRADELNGLELMHVRHRAQRIIRDLESELERLEKERANDIEESIAEGMDVGRAERDQLQRERDEARKGWALLAGSQHVDGEEGTGWFRWENEQHTDESRKWAEQKWPGTGAALFPEEES